jgi:hypothetical protein
MGGVLSAMSRLLNLRTAVGDTRGVRQVGDDRTHAQSTRPLTGPAALGAAVTPVTKHVLTERLRLEADTGATAFAVGQPHSGGMIGPWRLSAAHATS